MDDDNKAYMFFGGLWGGQLEKWTTGKFDINAKEPKGSDLALGPRVATLSDDMLSFAEAPQEVLIVDENGKPVLAGDEEKRFFEVHGFTSTMATITFPIQQEPPIISHMP
jgi:hypothetical protein